MKQYQKSSGWGFFQEILKSINQKYGLSDERGIHMISIKHGKEDRESAIKRYCEETGCIIGEDDIIFISDFGDADISSFEGKGQKRPEPKSVSKDATFDYPESGAFDRDQAIDLSDIPDAEPDPRSELHKRHIIAHRRDAQEPKSNRNRLDDVDEDYTEGELRRMGRKVIPFRGRKGKWAWMG